MDLEATALREAKEEIALDPAGVQVVGALPPVSTFVTGYRIQPFVGLVSDPLGSRPLPQPDRGRDGPDHLARRASAKGSRCVA